MVSPAARACEYEKVSPSEVTAATVMARLPRSTMCDRAIVYTHLCLSTLIPWRSDPSGGNPQEIRGAPAGDGSTLVALGIGVLLATIAPLVLTSDNDDQGDISASSQSTAPPTAAETVPTETNLPSSTAPAAEPTQTSIAVPTSLSAPEITTVAPTSPPTTQPPPEPATSEAANALVAALIEAYNNREWDIVRRINTAQSQLTDEQFTDGYGSADGLPRLYRAAHVVVKTESTAPGEWRIFGTLIAWDYNKDGGQKGLRRQGEPVLRGVAVPRATVAADESASRTLSSPRLSRDLWSQVHFVGVRGRRQSRSATAIRRAASSN